ncbi:Nn.00g031090.m01.CDS01 [Neocucurbitaria sp. VM-36]
MALMGRLTKDTLSLPIRPSGNLCTSPYELFNSQDGAIRLVELAPGRFDDTIKMQLIPGSLKAGPRQSYEALSYVWGTETAPRKAVLNGIPISITTNLDCALRHLRFVTAMRTLWVDAVSINQSDTQDRNHQVQIMGSIYSSAQRVIVWLGSVDESDLHLRATLGAMQFHFSEPNPSTVTLFDYVCSVISLMDSQAVITHAANELVLDTLHRIIDRHWFRRLWVVQELALSKTAMIFSILGISGFSGTPIEADYTKSPQRVFIEVMGMLLVDEKLAIYHHAPLQPLREDTRYESLPGLPSWVPDLRIAVAPDAEDLNMEHEERARLDAARTYNRPFNILRGSSRTGPRSRPLDEFVDGLCVRLPFPPGMISPDLTRLLTPGLPIGTIVETSGHLLDDLGDLDPYTGLPKHVYELYHTIVKQHGISPRSFVRALIGFERIPIIEYDEACVELFRPSMCRATISKEVRESIEIICARILSNATNGTLYITEDKSIGLSYHPDSTNCICPGDVVVGLFGVNYPFLLRAVDSTSYRMTNVARVVGHTWGHEFLDNDENG